MSNGSLSQEEIDALLQGVEEVLPESPSVTMPGAGGPSETGGLTDSERNTFLTIINSKFASASNTLSTITNKKVEITNPIIEIKNAQALRNEFPKDYIQVKSQFVEGLAGEFLFLFKKHDAAVIANLMMGEDGTSPPAELDELYINAIGEAINQINGGWTITIGDKIKKTVRVNPPVVQSVESPSALLLPPGDQFVKVTGTLSVEGLVASNIYEIYPLNFVKELVVLLSAPSLDYTQQAAGAPSQAPAPQMPTTPTQPKVTVQPVQFPNLSQLPVPPEQLANIQLLLDVPMQITVELGRTKMLVKEILSLGEGSIIELDKLAGEPVDLLVNNKLIAKGEVVVIDENFGVRVTDIINPAERLAGITAGLQKK